MGARRDGRCSNLLAATGRARLAGKESVGSAQARAAEVGPVYSTGTAAGGPASTDGGPRIGWGRARCAPRRLDAPPASAPTRWLEASDCWRSGTAGCGLRRRPPRAALSAATRRRAGGGGQAKAVAASAGASTAAVSPRASSRQDPEAARYAAYSEYVMRALLLWYRVTLRPRRSASSTRPS